MPRVRLFPVVMFLVAILVACHSKQDEATPRLNLNFRDILRNTYVVPDPGSHNLAYVFIFISAECPVSNLYLPFLNEIYRREADHGIAMFAVNSSPLDSLYDTAQHATEHEILFPIIKDWSGDLFRALKPDVTPQAVVVDREGNIRYSGRIDDQYSVGLSKPKASSTELLDALNAIEASHPVAVRSTAASGCPIDPPSSEPLPKVNFETDIAPILKTKCQGCHRVGGAGPFGLTVPGVLTAFQPLIKQALIEHRMPPWSADPKQGSFANFRGLTDLERSQLLSWVSAPQIEALKESPEPAEAESSEWYHGAPDLIWPIASEVHIPAKVVGPQTFFVEQVLDPGNETDLWIQGFEILPSNRRIVHHATLYTVQEGENPYEVDRANVGYVAAYAPGMVPYRYPDQYAFHIKAGQKLFLSIHYTPIGQVQTDRLRIGVYLSKRGGKDQIEVHTSSTHLVELDIPPFERYHQVSAVETLAGPRTLLSFLPHGHFRARAFHFEAELPDGTKKILGSVPLYDFNWQTSYVFSNPITLPAGTKLTCRAQFDNSKLNPLNPDPSARVRWGVNSTDEMMFCYYDYVEQP